ncbi:hypothetical protein EXS74_03155 [Candidatus Woesearchaeota archaeon]|nr:hypothetical protein [Candidatus Woesearchaeota archaeon]
MNKIGTVLLIFLLSMSIASAGFWSDNSGFMITGNVVAENGAEILEGEQAPGTLEPVSNGESPPTEQYTPNKDQYQEPPYSEKEYEEYKRDYSSGKDQAPSYNEGKYEENSQNSEGTYCGDGNCDLEDGEQYSWCPDDCTEDQTQDEYRQSKGYDQDYYGDYSQECPDETMLAEMSAKCEDYGGLVTERTDPNSGCTISECFFDGNSKGEGSQAEGIFGKQGCQSEEEASEQSSICEELGSEAIAVPSPPGCAPKIVCAQSGQGYGSGYYSYDEYQEGQEKFESGELGSAQVLEVILKMDSIKIQLSGLQEKMNAIAAYYEEQGDSESADNYKEGAEILDQVATKIDEQKTALKEAVEAGTLDYETIYQIRSELKYSVDELLNQVISALLGIDYTGIAEEAASGSDCGSNTLCFEEYFRSCAAGATFNSDSSVTVTIDGTTENDECTLSMSTPMGSGTCTVPDYRYALLSEEAIKPYCDDTLQSMFEQYEKNDETESIVDAVEPLEEEIEETCTDSDGDGTCDEVEEVPEEPVEEEEVIEESEVV